MLALLVAMLVVGTVFGWLLFGDKLGPGEPATKGQELEQKLEVSLADLRDRGVNVDAPILWNYLFVHRHYPQLGRFMEHMKRSGYEVAEVNEVNDGETGLIDYEIRLQIRERHTPESLAAKLSEMKNLAARWDLDVFDGWYPEGYVERSGEVEH
jgi:regulator of RNase E activity RraB